MCRKFDRAVEEAFVYPSGLPVTSQVHRLDKDTSGCLIVALLEQSAVAVTGLFRHKTATAVSRDAGDGEATEKAGLQRAYWALVEGIPAQTEGIIDAPVKKVSRTSRWPVLITTPPRHSFFPLEYWPTFWWHVTNGVVERSSHKSLDRTTY